MSWKLAGQTTGSTAINIQDIISVARDLLLIVEFSYNSPGAKARVEHFINPNNYVSICVSGYYYGPNDYASIACVINSSGVASISSAWWKVMGSGESIPLSDDTAKLLVYYR